MNDFTKDELQYILDELKATNVRQVHAWLIDKIRPMIDNYCKHDQYTPVLGDVDCYQCDKCNEIILK